MNKNERIGRHIRSSLVAGESYNSYIPQPLPPKPTVELDQLYPLLDQANTALGRLDGISINLPDISLFLYMYVRKEAVLSSQIEGTQSSLSDLLLFENGESPTASIHDVNEVSSYVSAMSYGLERLKNFPLSLRLIKEIHEKLMNNARGSNKQPGEFRTSQNWIGGSRPGNAVFVPPSPEYLMECLDNFEKFLHDENVRLPILVKTALAHVQFETIHPFLDGNGRLGRLLITLILCTNGVLKEPLLYLSLYFKTHREEYYRQLQSVRLTGDWESWLRFFLVGIIETANQATTTAHAIINLLRKDLAEIEKSNRSTASTITIYNFLQKNPITNTSAIKKGCTISLPTIIRNLDILQSLNIVKEITGKDRHKIFVYQEYLNILNNETTTPFSKNS